MQEHGKRGRLFLFSALGPCRNRRLRTAASAAQLPRPCRQALTLVAVCILPDRHNGGGGTAVKRYAA